MPVRSPEGTRTGCAGFVGRGSAPAGPVSQTGHSGGGGAPLPGTKTRRQELADGRGWSTCRKRGPHTEKSPNGAPEGATWPDEGRVR